MDFGLRYHFVLRLLFSGFAFGFLLLGLSFRVVLRVDGGYEGMPSTR